MNENFKTPKIILFDRTEIKVQNGTQYLVVYDKLGIQHKISEKRQPLWGAFTNAKQNEAFILVYETYNKTQYVADVKRISDELLQRAVQDLGGRLIDAQSDERNRSTALSYAKDMVIADKITLKKLYDRAKRNYDFIKGNYETGGCE